MTGGFVVCICILILAAFAGRSGTAYADATDGQPGANHVLRIDAEKTGEPISKYVYGQFLENLPRVIYQSIWAELIVDRKFYTPVGEEILLGGDLIMAVDGRAVTRSNNLTRLFQRHRPGDSVELQIFRDGRRMTVSVEKRNVL